MSELIQEAVKTSTTLAKLFKGIDKIVVVDPGKNAVKVLVFSTKYELLKKFIFPSKSLKKRNFYDIDSSSENLFKIVHNGEKFILGEGVNASYDFDPTKNNEHHQRCIYTAVAKAMDKPLENIRLIVGYPSSDYTNPTQRKAYEDLINTETVSLEFNDEGTKTFNIKGFNVLPEGIAFKPRVLVGMNKAVKVIDIGGQNTNFRIYDQKGNTLQSFSLDKAGMNHLEGFIKAKLRKFVQADKVDINSIDYDMAIKNRKIVEINPEYLQEYKNTEEFIEDAIFEFIESNIIGQLKQRGEDITQRGHYIIFTGGGSLALKDYLKECLPNNKDNMTFSDTAQWDNCISYIIKDLSHLGKANNISKEAQLTAKKVLNQTDFGEKKNKDNAININ